MPCGFLTPFTAQKYEQILFSHFLIAKLCVAPRGAHENFLRWGFQHTVFCDSISSNQTFRKRDQNINWSTLDQDINLKGLKEGSRAN